MPDRPRILLTFIPEPDDRPWPIRVRGLLKFGKRAQAPRCVAAEEVPAADPGQVQVGQDPLPDPRGSHE
jgi:hypothetical protein